MRAFIGKTAVMVGLLSGAALGSSLAWAQGQAEQSPFDQQPETRLACERLKAQIDQTIRDNGARHFLLEIVDNAQVEDDVVREGESFAGAEVVGSCDGGTRKVVYRRDGATEMSSASPQETSSGADPAGVQGDAEGGDGSRLPETAPVAPESSGEDALPTPESENLDAGQEPESSP
ncbi:MULTISPECIES: DUF1161 domain-containing protein [Salinicola]|uniref:DUF1161 domain-containing protein n=1 Tax=Salinicola socius TaxID=404433 RepID=A0A1Q8SP29_9GAMM|nr:MULTISPECIES: DUF1161 domain-containing protein [Salinicola]OLO03185.1 hypothetical protein BTW07_15740 [Salinicola socius]